MTRILLSLVSLASWWLTSGCGARCVKWDQASARMDRAGTEEKAALDAELRRRGLTLVQPEMIRAVTDLAAPVPWRAEMAAPKEPIDVMLPTLMSVGDPRPVVKDAQGRFFTVVVTGPVAREEVVLCGCDPGQGIEMRPSMPYWQVPMGSLDDYEGDVEIRIARRQVTTRYERDTGAPGECHSAP